MDGDPCRAAQPRRRDCYIVACDGLKGLPEAVGEIWPKATVQLRRAPAYRSMGFGRARVDACE